MGKLHVQQNTCMLHGGLLSAFEYSFVGWWSVHDTAACTLQSLR